MEAYHAKEYQESRVDFQTGTVIQQRKKLRQLTIVEGIRSQGNSECGPTIATTFAALSLPLALIEDEAFINMMYRFRYST